MPDGYVLDADDDAFLRDLVRDGRYASAGEALRDALRLLKERERARALRATGIRAAIEEARADPALLDEAEVFDRIEDDIREVEHAGVETPAGQENA